MGLLTFRIFLSFYSFTGKGHQDEFSLYVWGWAVFVPGGILKSALIEEARRRHEQLKPFLYLPLIFIDFLLLLLFYMPCNWGRDNGWLLLFHFILFQVSGITLSVILGQPPNRSPRLDGLFYPVMGFLLIFWLTRIPEVFNPILNNWSLYSYGFVPAVITLFYFGTLPFSKKNLGAAGEKKSAFEGPRNKIFSYGVAFLLISLVVVDPRFEHDRHHAAFFLGPLADLSAGKSLLVNINSQYGILIFYFLRLFFHALPLGFTSFTLVYTILLILEYLLFFFIVRLFFDSEWLSFFCLTTFLLLNYFGPSSYITRYPSAGPLRFGLFYLLTALVLLRNRHPNKRNIFLFIESIFVAIAFYWSFEVCIYTVSAYVGLVLYECIYLQTRPQLNLEQFKKRIGMLVGCITLIGVFVYVDVFLRSGRLPNWLLYFDHIFAYVGGFGKLSAPLAGYWWVLIWILLGSFFAIIGCSIKISEKEKTEDNLNAVVFLTFFGILQFSYYLSRASNDYLFYISMPSLVLLVYWLVIVHRSAQSRIPRGFKTTFFGITVVFLGLYLQSFFPRVAKKMEGKALPLSAVWKNFKLATKDMPRDDIFAHNAEELFEKYSGSNKFLVYFFGEKGLEVSLYTGRYKIYPYNDFVQAGQCKPVLEQISLFDPHLKPGDFIYCSDNSFENNIYFENFEPKIFRKISTNFHLQLVDSKSGIYVYRVLGPRT